MPTLLAALLVTGVNFEGAWTHDLGGEQIYIFTKNGFRLIVRHMIGRKAEDAGYRLIYTEQGTLSSHKKSYKVGGQWKAFDSLTLQRTGIQPPGVEENFARNEPKRTIRLDFVQPNVLSMGGWKWIRIDPRSVPKTPDEIKTMKVVALSTKTR